MGAGWLQRSPPSSWPPLFIFPFSSFWLGQMVACNYHQSKKSESKVAQSCPTLCDPMYCSLSGSSAHGIFQARVLEWVAISFSRGCSRPRNRTQVSRIAGRRFTVWATREANLHVNVCSAVTSFNMVMCIKNECVTFPRSIKSCDFAFQCRGYGFNPWSGC